MAGNTGNVLPVYVMIDESASMHDHLDVLMVGLQRLHDALLGEPMAAAKVRFSVLGFADDVEERLPLADLRRESEMPRLVARGGTRYRPAFEDLRERIPRDVVALKSQGYSVHRPAVFFLSDGLPNDAGAWEEQYSKLVDRAVTPAAPNIIAFGVGDANAPLIVQIASRPDYAFIAVESVDIGNAVAQFTQSLTKSIVRSGRTLGSEQPELIVERPQNFRMAIDVV